MFSRSFKNIIERITVNITLETEIAATWVELGEFCSALKKAIDAAVNKRHKIIIFKNALLVNKNLIDFTDCGRIIVVNTPGKR